MSDDNFPLKNGAISGVFFILNLPPQIIYPISRSIHYHQISLSKGSKRQNTSTTYCLISLNACYFTLNYHFPTLFPLQSSSAAPYLVLTCATILSSLDPGERKSPFFFFKKNLSLVSLQTSLLLSALLFCTVQFGALVQFVFLCPDLIFVQIPPLILAVESCPCVSVCVHLFVYCVSLFMLK